MALNTRIPGSDSGRSGGGGLRDNPGVPANVTPGLLPAPNVLSPYGDNRGYGSNGTQEAGYSSGPDPASLWKSWFDNYKSYLDQLLKNNITENRQIFGKQRNISNNNYVKVDRAIDRMFGPDQGRSVLLKSSNGIGWANTNGNIRDSWANADAKVRAQHSHDLADAYNAYATAISRYL